MSKHDAQVSQTGRENFRVICFCGFHIYGIRKEQTANMMAKAHKEDFE